LVLADGGEAPGVITAETNPARVIEARDALPTLTNARAYAIPSSRRAVE
jgi:predicted amidohydrolase